MGCCLSRSTTTPSHPQKPHNPTSNLRQPPPPPLEEETVKEVLTETPFALTPNNNSNNKVKEEKKSLENLKQRDESADIEASEITSATENRSESVSVGGGEKRGEEVMSKCRDRADAVFLNRPHRSTDQSPVKVLKRRPYSGEQTPREKRVRSPATRAVLAPSPRAARGRSQSPATSNPRNVMNAGRARIRRDYGERSGRRSRSPGRKASQINNYSSSNRAGTSTEVNGKVNGGHKEGRGTGTVDEEGEACPAADESLDNPLVSLECFIFL